MAKTPTTKAVQAMLRAIGKSPTTPVTIGGRQPARKASGKKR